MSTNGRVRNSIYNIMCSMGAYFLTVLLAFVERRFFVQSLSNMYLGIGGVMANIISILSISELGFGEAIMFSLYKPIRENDENKIVALLNLYKKAYRIIVLIIFAVSIVILPFLSSFFKDAKVELRELVVIYILFVINTMVSYIGAYRRSAIIALQKRYVISIVHGVTRATMYVMQIVSLIVWPNYYLTLCITLTASLCESIIVFIVSGRIFPIVKRKEKILVPKEEKEDIYKKIGAMAMHKVGGTCVTGTDNLLISWFVGVVKVGLYSNYLLIKTTITTVTQSIFTSIVASMGNLGNADRAHSKNVFYSILYGSNWLFGMCSVCLICLYDNFISIWLGSDYILDSFTVALIVISFYLQGMRQAVLMTRDAFGLFDKDKWKPIAEAFINLAVSIVLGIFIGLPGIILGTIISTLTTCFWVEPYVLFKYGFEDSLKGYYIRYILYTLIWVCGYVLCKLICDIIVYESLIGFILKAIICFAVTNVLFFACTFKTKEFIFLKNKFIRKDIKKKQSKETPT